MPASTVENSFISKQKFVWLSFHCLYAPHSDYMKDRKKKREARGKKKKEKIKRGRAHKPDSNPG